MFLQDKIPTTLENEKKIEKKPRTNRLKVLSHTKMMLRCASFSESFYFFSNTSIYTRTYDFC